nr:hypothetical protein [Rhizobium sp. CF122]
MGFITMKRPPTALAACGKTDRYLRRAEAIGSTGFCRNRSRKSFGEYTRDALSIDTTKTPGAKSDLCSLILTWQIGDLAHVVTVNATAGLAASGAIGRGRNRPCRNDDCPTLAIDLHDLEILWKQRVEKFKHEQITA